MSSACVQQVSQLPRITTIEGHFHPVPFFLTSEMFGGIPFSIAGGNIEQLVDRPVAELHTHDVPEIYFLISPDAGGAEIEVQVNDQILHLTSPSALYVPAGMNHRFVTKKAQKGSYCFGIFVLAPRDSS